MGTAQEEQGLVSTRLTSFFGNLTPTPETETRPNATVTAVESESQQTETADCVNYGTEEQYAGEFLCRIQIGDMKHLSTLGCLLVLTLAYISKEVSREGIQKKSPAWKRER
jgi:hypothetical protein